ncbi:flagellar protein FlgN [Clostridium sp. BJN0001]|uniref:flagellar protein FlgN n=1 Tax=Clostridium sp. BJN0001 TaxID=2930219 RepID=UPI001FD11C44|nr:flagellar protein FlgN [Clostridium sp. BJN0001]
MIDKIIRIINDESKALEDLLMLLKMQYDLLMKQDVFGLEGIIEKINASSKVLAKYELDRRNLLGKQSFKNFVASSNSDKLKESYEKVKETLEKTNMQKETNDVLVKQKLLFTNKMLSIMNPNREANVYNSYGNIKRK